MPYGSCLKDIRFTNGIDRLYGWAYQLAISKVVSVDMISYEGTGIPPDIHVAILPDNIAMEKDPVIEMAIQLLNN